MENNDNQNVNESMETVKVDRLLDVEASVNQTKDATEKINRKVSLMVVCDIIIAVLILLLAIMMFLIGMRMTQAIEDIDMDYDGCSDEPEYPWETWYTAPWESGDEDIDLQLDKPVIYFYNNLEEGESANYTLVLSHPSDSTIRMTYPEVSSTDNNSVEWDVTLNGGSDEVVVDGEAYDYIFWDAESSENYITAYGTCVSGEDTYGFIDEYLDMIGFNTQEKQDFLTYWVPQMRDNEYNVITFLFDDSRYGEDYDISILDEDGNLAFVSVNRVFMVWHASDEYVNLPGHQNIVPFNREGTYIVEWGGMEIK